MSTGKTILIVGAVGVGAFVVLKLVTPPKPPANTVRAPSSDSAWISGLLQFGTALVQANRSAPPPASLPAPTGPSFFDSSGTGSGSFDDYAPGSSSPGPWAPTGTGVLA